MVIFHMHKDTAYETATTSQEKVVLVSVVFPVAALVVATLEKEIKCTDIYHVDYYS